MNKFIKQGFTLIELLVVIAIIGILSGLIVVSMSGVTSKASVAKSQVFSNSLRNALMLNLISEWRFDGDTADAWGSHNDGTWSGPTGTNTVVTYKTASECVSGQCLSFDGTDDCVSIANSTSLDVTTAFTIEMWIKRSAISSDRVGLLRRDSSDTYALFTNINSTNVQVRFKDTLAAYHGSTYVNIPTGQWNHLVGTYDGRYLKFYLNSVLSANDDTGGSYTVAAGTNNLIIGRDDAVAGRYFNGLIDGVRVYGSSVPSSQIKQNYYVGLNSLLANGNISKEEYKQRSVNLLAIK